MFIFLPWEGLRSFDLAEPDADDKAYCERGKITNGFDYLSVYLLFLLSLSNFSYIYNNLFDKIFPYIRGFGVLGVGVDAKPNNSTSIW